MSAVVHAIVKRHAAMEFAVLQISAAMELFAHMDAAMELVVIPYCRRWDNKSKFDNDKLYCGNTV
jgi:hypothetical protein